MFESLQMLNIKKTTKYSVVTVVKWGEYQNHEQQMNSKRTTNEQPMNTNNNVNNLNKKDMSVQQAELFMNWWNLYDKKTGKKQCEAKFMKLLKQYDYSVIEAGTKRYLAYLQQNNIAKQYQKNPLSFLNGEHFNDEYENSVVAPASTGDVKEIEITFD